jgi:hypothetical protein
MKKFIAIAGAVLLGSVVSHGVSEERLVNALEHELTLAERDVQTIKGHLQGVMNRRRARSVDSAPRVEALSRSYGSRNLGSRTSTPTMHPIEMAHLGTQMLTGLAGTGAGMYSQIMQGQAAAAQQQYYQQQMAQMNQQPQVEGFLGGLGELTGAVGDLTGLGLGIYQTIEQPRVEGFLGGLGGLGELTGGLGDLAGLGLGIYQTIEQPRVEGFLGGLGGLGELTGGLGDLAGLGLGIYQTIEQPRVEAPLYSSRTSTRPRSNSMHPMEMAHLGTQMITGLGETGAGMYSQIMQG